MLYAGCFYSALGLLQSIVAWTTGVDLFPMLVDTADESSAFVRSAVSGDFSDRISSICGEPRYLAAYACLWFLITVTLGKRIGLPPRVIRLCTCVFLVTIVLTGARTALGILIVVGSAIAATTVCTVRMTSLVRVLASALALGGIAALLITSQTGSLGTRSTANLDENNSIGILGARLPVEGQDQAALMVLAQKPVRFLSGVGPGLWQYYENPWDQWQVRAYLPSAAVRGADSLKSNFQPINRLCNYGVIGLCVVWSVVLALYELGRAALAPRLAPEYLLRFVAFSAFLQVSGMAEQLGFLVMGVLVLLYHD